MRALAPLAVLTAAWLASAPAKGEGLSRADAERLESGATVTRTQTLERGERHYVGGVTYTVIDAQPGDLERLLGDVKDWQRFLPKTREAHRVGTVGGDPLVEVTHGSSLFQVSYTMRVHRDGNVLQFWMDPSRPHGIEDAWGFFRTQPIHRDRTLVTYGILIDMGPGVLRNLFESRVRELALTVPQRVRGLLLERGVTGYAESPLVTEAIARY
jgi:hypothetical protein